MRVIETVSEMLHISSQWDNNQVIGFVPTMGALHQGHLALVKESKKQSDLTIVSIYVNPSQFGPNEDFDKYPKTFEADSKLLEALDVDYIFLPNDKEMYPQGYNTWVEVNELTSVLCGAKRPGHFRGVCTIVLKLVNIVRPSLMFMGEKDFQQVAVLKTMLKDLNILTKIVACPIVRDVDGLALSSRNKYLNDSDRTIAPTIYKTLLKAKEAFYNNELDTLEQLASYVENELDLTRFIIDYIEIVDSGDLKRRKYIEKGNRLLIAVYLGQTRLIDNIEI